MSLFSRLSGSDPDVQKRPIPYFIAALVEGARLKKTKAEVEVALNIQPDEQVDFDTIWTKVMAGPVLGFSIELYFVLFLSEFRLFYKTDQEIKSRLGL